MTDNLNKADEELAKSITYIIERHGDYIECDEWHIHGSTEPLMEDTDDSNNHKDYDEDKAVLDVMQAIKQRDAIRDKEVIARAFAAEAWRAQMRGSEEQRQRLANTLKEANETHRSC